MILVPEKKIRKYVAFENGKWIHDPNMPEYLVADFEEFVSKVNNEMERCIVEKANINK